MAILSCNLSDLGIFFSTYGEDSELNSTRILGEDRIQEDFECNECQFNAHYYYKNFEMDDYCEELVSKFNTHFADELRKILPDVQSVQFTGYKRPREYNFSDDEWSLTIRYKGKRDDGILGKFKAIIENLDNKEDYKIFDTNSFSELFEMCYSDFIDTTPLEWFLEDGILHNSINQEMMDSLLKTCLRKDLFHTMYSTHSVEEIIEAYDIDEDFCFHIDLIEKIISNWCKEIEEKSLLLTF